MKICPLDAWTHAARLSICLAALALQGCGGGGGGGGSQPTAEPASEMPARVTTPANTTPTIAPTAATTETAAVAPASNSEATTKQAEVTLDAAQATSADNCLKVPAAPVTSAAAGSTRSVAEFGAVPDDSADDTIAIQRALDSLKSGQTLTFPAGRYLTNKRLRVRVAGSILDGRGATMHATNPDDQAVLIEADDVTVHSFFLTAITTVRRSAPWHSRIAVYAENADGSRKIIRRSVIRDNTVTHQGAPGTPGANGASSAGILLLHADNFLVTGNTVVRTLADGIHVTSGSRNGRILNNTVRETGDDMIAVVSYAGDGPAALGTAARVRSAWTERLETQLNRNILIADNKVSGQYWGRGIAVVGGKDVTIRRNTLDNIPLAAGILVAREASYESFGVNNVVVEGNTLTNVQNRQPPYDVGNKFASTVPFGHGALEVHASMFDDEAADSMLKAELTVRNVRVSGNTVRTASVPGLRAGVAFNSMVDATDPTTGAKMSRHQQTSAVQVLSSQSNQFNGIGGSDPMTMVTAGLSTGNLHCKANTRDGQPYSVAACVRTEPTVTGTSLRCTAAGLIS